MKNIIKRGIKDVSEIQTYIESKLEGSNVKVINVNEKIFNNLLCRYGRFIPVCKSIGGVTKYAEDDSLLYKDDIYAFEEISEWKNGKYGSYKRVKLYNINGYKQECIQRRIDDYKGKFEEQNKRRIKKGCEPLEFNKELYNLYLELWRVQESFKFSSNLNTSKATVKKIYEEDYNINSEKEDIILDKIEDLEEKLGY